jgi:tetratricopeptide (TPR) repeat protein
MAPDVELTPTAKGSFSTKPFAHILVFLFEKKMSGTLDVQQQDTLISIYFRTGAPAKVQTSVKNRTLSQVLLGLGLVTSDQLEACNAKIAKMGGLQGQTLVELGAIDVKTLVRGLKEQMLLKLTDVFGLAGGSYAFYQNVNKLAGFGADEVFPIHPYPVLMAGLRHHADKLDMTPMLNSLSDKWLALEENLEVVRGFRLSRAEKQVVGALLTGPRSFQEIAESGAWDNDVARYVLYILLITRQLRVTAEAPSARSEAEPPKLSTVPPPALPSLDSKLAALRDGILDKAKLIATQSYYEMLDLPKDASMEDARRAFFRLSKRFHPDRLAPALRDELGETAEYIFSNLKEAETVLTDPLSREAYDRAMSGGPERSISSKIKDESVVRDALEAEALFQRALVFLKQSRLDKTAELLEQARILNPKEGEYLALETHLKVLSRPAGANLDDLVDKLRRASADCPRSEQVTYFLADALKRAGKLNQARTYFEKTLELNPHNIEAARTLRFLEREKLQSGDKKRHGSLFTKIFK